MTKSEKRQKRYEELCKKESEKLKIVITSDNIYENCKECEYCKSFRISEEKEILKCERKARKDIEIMYQYPEMTCKSKLIGYYPYGEISGKCPNFTFMRMMSEF